MDPFTQVKSAEHMAKFNIKINFKSGHSFSLTSMSKCKKRPWNLYKYKNSLLKTYFSWPQRTECTREVSSKTSLPWSGLKQAKRPAVKNKVEFLERQFHNETLNCFVGPQKENRALVWAFSFHLCLVPLYFQSWKAKLWSWNHRMMNARQLFCWWMSFTKG